MRSLRYYRVRLAEWIAGPGYQVVSNEVFDGLLGAHVDHVVAMVTQAVQYAPALFPTASRSETKH
jgi:hypothetical protein